MRTMGLSFNPLFRSMFFRLILRSSAGLLVYLCFQIQQIPSMGFWSLLLLISSGISFMHIHRERSEHMLTSKSMPFLPRTARSRKIVQHNLWPTVRQSELVLKRAQFLYAIVMRLPFCLCTHILNIMLRGFLLLAWSQKLFFSLS